MMDKSFDPAAVEGRIAYDLRRVTVGDVTLSAPSDVS